MRSNESFTNIFDNKSKESYSMSTEGMNIPFMCEYYGGNEKNVEYEKIFKKKVQKNGKYNIDLSLKLYNFMNYDIGFEGRFPRLKRFFKILSG